MSEPVTPYKNANLSKKRQVEQMFDNVAPAYDFLNHFMSLGIDIRWRKKAIRQLAGHRPKTILDVATGTADLAIEAARLQPRPMAITGIDLSEKMLELGRSKIAKRNLGELITLQKGDSEKLPFESNSFDAVTVAYGVRNFEHLEKGLSEMLRVLKPGGRVVILEFSKPKVFLVKQLFNFFFHHLTPLMGRLFSRDRAAYEYLPESVAAFPEGRDFLDILAKTGFKNYQCEELTFGISSIYSAEK